MQVQRYMKNIPQLKHLIKSLTSHCQNSKVLLQNNLVIVKNNNKKRLSCFQCDGVRPKCNTCQSKNLQCVYDVAEDGKTTTQLRAHVRRLAKELDDMKSIVSWLAMASFIFSTLISLKPLTLSSARRVAAWTDCVRVLCCETSIFEVSLQQLCSSHSPSILRYHWLQCLTHNKH